MHYVSRFIAVIISVLFAQSLFAAVASTAAPAVVKPAYVEPFNSGSLMQLLSGLILVVTLIFVLAWFVRRFTGLPGQNRALKVVASVPLGTREKLVLVQAGGKQLLLGVAPGRVNLIESYDEPLIDQAAQGGEFATRLQQVLNRKDSE